MAKSKVDEIKAEIKGFEEIIGNPNTTAPVKEAMGKALAAAQLALKKAESATGSAEAADKPVAKKEKTEKKKPGRKAKAKPAEEKPENKKKEEEDEPILKTIMVNGKPETFNIANCEEAIKAYYADKENKKKIREKSEGKSAGEKAEGSVERAVGNIEKLIPDSKIENDPKKVIAGLREFESHMSKAFDSLEKAGVSKTNIQKLKGALNNIHEIIEEISKDMEGGDKK